jgi:hypothetical protein
VFAGTCDADGGCRYLPLDAGTPCSDGGVCNGTGGCVPMWPYTPSNFTLTQVPSLPDAGVVLDCGETIIDTSGPAPTVTNWCPGQPMFGWGLVAQDGGVEVMIFSFRDLDVMADGGLTLKGTRPAIIAAAGRVRVLGGVTVEAGAQSCDSVGRGASPDAGNGGGGGGGFGTPGGNGGSGSAPGASGGAASGDVALIPLRAGCPGGVGGGNQSRAASGGGALQISAMGELIVSGHVAAPGKGGSGGGTWAGGNGGGSGGAVLLEGLQLVLVGSAAITANGGGGGGGGVGRVRLNSVLGCSIGPQVVLTPPATSNKPDAGCP